MANNQTQQNQTGEIEHVETTAVEPNAIESMERASIDVQITTANLLAFVFLKVASSNLNRYSK